MDPKRLKDIFVLKSLNIADLSLMAEMLDIMEFPGGTNVIHEDQIEDCLYFVLDGEVEIIKAIGTPNERLILIKGPNEILGEISLIMPDHRRTASVRTRCQVRLARLSRAQFLQFMEHRPAVAIAILQRITLRLRNAESDTIREMEKAHLELSKAYDKTLEGWAKAMELRNNETEEHNRRVGELAVKLAYTMGLRTETLVHIRRGALLHDIGKIGIPDTILLKPGPLNEAEWEIMRKHPVFARDMLAPIEFLAPAIDIPYCHHEKWDGSGYPNGLKGEDIPFFARIFSIVDAWDAMVYDRPYRKALQVGEALQQIIIMTGVNFDPAVSKAFIDLISL